MRAFSAAASHLATIGALHQFFGTRTTPAACLNLVRRRLETRETRFLDLLRRLVYDVPASPYRPLLRHAGCEHRDVEVMVAQRGLEGTLTALHDAGVFLTFEQFRGRADVVRGGRSFRFSFEEFTNPVARPGYEQSTGGTRSAGLRISVPLDNVLEQSIPANVLMRVAAGTTAATSVIWHTGFPGPGLQVWLAMGGLRRPPARWFCTRDPHEPAASAGARRWLQMARVVARAHGIALPFPEYAPVAAAEAVLDAVFAAASGGDGCIVVTTSSAAARLASLARERGRRLDGVCFLVGSEPLTPGKAEEIRATGAAMGVRYAFGEGGVAAVGCGHPAEPDDMHLAADIFAMIQREREYAGIPVESLVFTTLLASAPKIMLNVEIDDFAAVTRRRCGCPLEGLGYDVHLSNLRSFTKLTGEGISVLGTNCVDVIEQVLPREFGGDSVDYQLVEAEDEQHVTRLFLLVHPRLGALDEAAVRRRFMDAVADARGGQFPTIWRHAESLRVLRRPPVATRAGKQLPFHTMAAGDVWTP